MHATIFGRGQMVIPAKARREAAIGQGDLVEVRPEGNGRIVLIRMERPREPGRVRARIRNRRGTMPSASWGGPSAATRFANS